MLFRFTSGLKAFTVHERPDHLVARDDRAEELMFVKDGFSLFAALLPPVWMLVNRLWLVLAGYVIVVLSLIILFGVLAIPDFWLNYALLALSLLIGFEADSLIRWTLNRRAWRQVGNVTGATKEDCERRFFDSWLATIPAVSPANFASPRAADGLETSTADAAVKPLAGDLMPPKRTGWRSAMAWGRK